METRHNTNIIHIYIYIYNMCVLCICNVKIDIKKGNIKPKKIHKFFKKILHYYISKL